MFIAKPANLTSRTIIFAAAVLVATLVPGKADAGARDKIDGM